MNSFDALQILKQIGATSSRSEKEEILKGAISDPFFKEVLKWAYDPFITFGITPPEVESEGRDFFDLETRSVWSLLHGLKDRIITGNEAQQCVLDTLLRLSPDSAELLWRILSKDLRCGISDATINKVLPGTIPSFDVMLSHKYEEKRIKAFPCVYEPKLDGVRTICIVKDGTAKFFSRAGKPFPALEWMAPQIFTMLHQAIARTSEVKDEKLRALYQKLLGGSADKLCVVIEGEVFSGIFNEVSGSVRRKSEDATDAEYHIFDVLPYGLFMDSSVAEIKIPYRIRRPFTEFVVRSADPKSQMRLVPRYYAGSHKEIQEAFDTFHNMTIAHYLARGDEKLEAELLPKTLDKKTGEPKTMEGIIVKPLDGTYQKKRSFNWLKIKAEETDEFRIVGAEEGTGKNKGKLGALVIDVEGVEVKVGGGFSDAQRDEFWLAYGRDLARLAGHDDAAPAEYHALGCELLGRLIEVEFHEKTPDGSLRHPRFIRFRDDKDDTLKEAA